MAHPTAPCTHIFQGCSLPLHMLSLAFYVSNGFTGLVFANHVIQPSRCTSRVGCTKLRASYSQPDSNSGGNTDISPIPWPASSLQQHARIILLSCPHIYPLPPEYWYHEFDLYYPITYTYRYSLKIIRWPRRRIHEQLVWRSALGMKIMQRPESQC